VGFSEVFKMLFFYLFVIAFKNQDVFKMPRGFQAPWAQLHLWVLLVFAYPIFTAALKDRQ